MRKFISTVIATLVLTGVHGRVPGWFYSVRGGTGLLPKMYPDALTSVVHGCAELDSETDAKQKCQNVKSSGAPKKVVKTVSHDRVDNVLFEKLNDKLFHHDHDDHHDREGEEPATAKISYGAREFLLEDDMFE